MTRKILSIISLVFVLVTLSQTLFSLTIAEKKRGLSRGITDLDPETEQTLLSVNRELSERRGELNALYAEVQQLHDIGASREEFEEILQKINVVRDEIQSIDFAWRETAMESSTGDLYALMHQPDTTIEQFVIDYGSQDFVYVVPPAIGETKISVNSNFPIPRASWESMVGLILTQNGIGIRELNPFLRELYFLTEESTPVSTITDNPDDIPYLPRNERVAFILRPDPSEVRKMWTFLHKFINPRTTKLEQFGREIIIVSQAGEIQDLLRLYNFAAQNKTQTEYKLVPLSKIPAREMGDVITTMFDHLGEGGDAASEIPVGGLKVIVLDSLSQGIFLVGTPDEITQAEKMIRRIEGSIGGGRETVVEWYTVRHSVAQELADTLQEIYSAMVSQRIGASRGGGAVAQGDLPLAQRQEQGDIQQNVNLNDDLNAPYTIFNDSYFLDIEPVIDPFRDMEAMRDPPKNSPNFIVYEKTGAIIMVVEKDYLERLMEIVKRLDIPKKMVQIDVLLFERRCKERTDYGLNLLKIGSCAENVRKTAVCWDLNTIATFGIFDFILSRPKTDNNPAFDLVYRFLLTQEHLSLNSNPSVVTINQVPAEISIREERSISTGVNFIATTNANTPRESFVRAQYGIAIKVTPTIHLWNEDSGDPDGADFITLETYINFDTVEATLDAIADRPNVIRRTLENEVLVADGQTVVMGGLRRKTSADARQSIPFFGEIPGFGKLFSMTETTDETTEMLIFLTPKIIHDPCEDIERLKFEKLSQRPGDIPAFLCRLNESRNCYQCRAFAQTLRIICGAPNSHYFPTQTGCVPAWMMRGVPTCLSWDYDGS